MSKELDQMRALFEGTPQKVYEDQGDGSIAEWNAQFEATPTDNPHQKFEDNMAAMKARYEKAIANKVDPKKAAADAAKVMDESFSLLESGDAPVEDADSIADRERREQECKINRVMDSWFNAKTAAMNAKYEELKLKYPDDPDKVKSAFDKWLRLAEAAMSGQDKEDPEDEEGDEGDDLATEKDLDDPEDEDDDKSEDPPEVDPGDDSILNDAGSDEDDNGEFTEEENEIIDGLIESETDGISDYSKALNETNDPTARKLYTEILSDESKHLAQLKYLKAKKNGEDYVPKDTEAKDELDALVEGVLNGTDIL